MLKQQYNMLKQQLKFTENNKIMNGGGSIFRELFDNNPELLRNIIFGSLYKFIDDDNNMNMNNELYNKNKYCDMLFRYTVKVIKQDYDILERTIEEQKNSSYYDIYMKMFNKIKKNDKNTYKTVIHINDKYISYIGAPNIDLVIYPMYETEVYTEFNCAHNINGYGIQYEYYIKYDEKIVANILKIIHTNSPNYKGFKNIIMEIFKCLYDYYRIAHLEYLQHSQDTMHRDLNIITECKNQPYICQYIDLIDECRDYTPFICVIRHYTKKNYMNKTNIFHKINGEDIYFNNIIELMEYLKNYTIYLYRNETYDVVVYYMLFAFVHAIFKNNHITTQNSMSSRIFKNNFLSNHVNLSLCDSFVNYNGHIISMYEDTDINDKLNELYKKEIGSTINGIQVHKEKI